ncbi:MAG: hypothetical protein WD883_00435 [Candidatus Colwellbacteria bacterium]
MPNIRIKRGYLLEPIFTSLIRSRQGKDWNPLRGAQLSEKITQFQLAWAKEGDSIMEAICSFLGLDFAQKEIDVYIVPGISALSDPLIVGSNIKVGLFTDMLTHELIHRLLTENTRELPVGNIWREMFPDVDDRKVLNHILVHAVHKHIYLDVLEDKVRYEEDVERATRKEAYKKSWAMVNELGYTTLIENFKKHY